MPFLRQTSFLGGELAPRLWGRTDLPVFGKGARTLRNFFVSPEGAGMTRPGSEYVDTASDLYDPDGAVGVKHRPRLVPFVASDTESYVLLFGDVSIRFFRNGAEIEAAAIAGGFDGDALWQLQWVQSGDVLFLTHPESPPKTLTRVSETSWTLETLSVAVAAADPPNGRLVKPLPVADTDHPARDWGWMYTIQLRRADGSVYENAPSKVLYMEDADGTNDEAVATTVAVYPDMAVTLRNTGMGLGAEEMVAVRWYRGRGGMYGWIGDVEPQSGSTWLWIDTGRDPDYSRPPPSGRASLEEYNSSGTLTGTQEPAAVAFFQERLMLLGTEERPAWVFASATGDYGDFDEHVAAPVKLADGALSFELACRRRESIRSAVGLEKLLIFTSSSAWALAGHQGEPLSYDSVDAKVVENIGANYLPPLVVGNAALYARAKGTGVRAIMPANTESGYAGVDISANSAHLFGQADGDLVDWTYAEDPWGLVWAVRADGVLLSLQFRPAEQVACWTRHDTDGEVLAICAVPEGAEDAVYMAVLRDNPAHATWAPAGYPEVLVPEPSPTLVYLERMTSRVRYGTVEDDACVDCALRWEGVPTTAITGLAHLEAKAVYVVGKDNPVQGPFTVDGGAITLTELPVANDGANAVLWIGLLYQPELETLGAASSNVRLLQKTTVSVGLELDEVRGLHVGQDLEHLRELKLRKVSDDYGALGVAATVVKVAVDGKWDLEARGALRQTLPLPVTVTGITREVSVGG